jgi:hypothetical protein
MFVKIDTVEVIVELIDDCLQYDIFVMMLMEVQVIDEVIGLKLRLLIDQMV